MKSITIRMTAEWPDRYGASEVLRRVSSECIAHDEGAAKAALFELLDAGLVDEAEAGAAEGVLTPFEALYYKERQAVYERAAADVDSRAEGKFEYSLPGGTDFVEEQGRPTSETLEITIEES